MFILFDFISDFIDKKNSWSLFSQKTLLRFHHPAGQGRLTNILFKPRTLNSRF